VLPNVYIYVAGCVALCIEKYRPLNHRYYLCPYILVGGIVSYVYVCIVHTYVFGTEVLFPRNHKYACNHWQLVSLVLKPVIPFTCLCTMLCMYVCTTVSATNFVVGWGGVRLGFGERGGTMISYAYVGCPLVRSMSQQCIQCKHKFCPCK
jgi:hypothetical protein